MIFFLVLEGYLGLTMIEQMRDVTHNIFHTSLSGFQSIVGANQDLVQIQKQFSENLLSHQPLNITATNIETVANDYSSYSSAAVSTLKNALEALKGFSGKIPAVENYEEFNRSVRVITMSLNSIQEQLSANAIQSMNSGNQFFSDSRFTSINLWLPGGCRAEPPTQ